MAARLLTAALKALGGIPDEFYRALIIRTLPNSAAKLSMNYSGTNPPYFSRAAMRLIRQLGTEQAVDWQVQRQIGVGDHARSLDHGISL